MGPGFNSREKRENRWSPRKLLGSQAGNWEITYTGFILILLCLFIMLSSFASMEEAKIFRFVKSFTTAVSMFTGGLKFQPGKEVLNQSPDIVSKKDPLAEFIRDLQGAIVGLPLREDLKEGVEVTEEEGKVLIRISDNVLFPSGSADIAAEGLPLLQRIAQLLKGTDYHLRVEGHTDNVPIRTARYPSNWELSTARAVNVLRYFSEKEGFLADRLSAVGLGEYHPIAANDTEAHRARNRRVELVIAPPGERQSGYRATPVASAWTRAGNRDARGNDRDRPGGPTTSP